MRDVKLKKFISSAAVGAFSSAAALAPSSNFVKGINFDIPEAARAAVREALNDEKVQNLVDKAGKFLEKMNPEEIKELKDKGVDFLDKFIDVGKETVPKINKVLGITKWIGRGVLGLIGFSLFSNIYDFAKKVFGFGKKEGFALTYGNYLSGIERLVDKMPLNDEAVKISIFSSIMSQFTEKELLNKKLDHKANGELVVIAGSGNSLLLESFAKDLKNLLCDKNGFSSHYEKVDGKKTTIYDFFEKIERARKGEGEYKEKSGILILDFDGEPSLKAEDDELKDNYSGYFFEFERNTAARLALGMLKDNISKSESFFSSKGVKLELSKDFLIGAYKKFKEVEESKVFSEVTAIVNNIYQQVVTYTKDKDFKKSLLGRVGILVDVDENGIIVLRNKE